MFAHSIDSSIPETALRNHGVHFDAHSANRPIRVLHLLGALNRGGIEVWLMNILRQLDRQAIQFDFAVHTRTPGAFNDEVQQLGCRLFSLDAPRNKPWIYKRQLKQLLQEAGPFDAVHSHAHFFSGYILRVVAQCGIPMRIAHSHNDSRVIDGEASLPRRAYTSVMRRWIKRYASTGLACSSWAAAALFGPRWSEDPRLRVLHYGLDFSRFAQLPARDDLRRQLGLPLDRRIIGQVGRFHAQKNHVFTVRIIQELVRSGLDAHMLLVGGGPLETEIRQQIQMAGLSDRATLVGDQSDVAPFLGAMDCMLFPSLHEGLGIVALEAQAAGTPTIASERVPPDVDVIPGMVEHLPLSAGPEAWTQAVASRLINPEENCAAVSVTMLENAFGVQQSVNQLTTLYREAIRRKA